MVTSLILAITIWIAMALGIFASIGLVYLDSKEKPFLCFNRKLLIGLLCLTCLILALVMYFDCCRQTIFIFSMWLVTTILWISDSVIED